MWTKQRKVGQREGQQRDATTTIATGTNDSSILCCLVLSWVEFFGAPYPNFIGASRAFITLALWAFIFVASRAVWAGPCNYCNFYLTQPIGLYWQLDYGYYSIWSRLMQLICTTEDPFWEHFETYFYSYQTSSK